MLKKLFGFAGNDLRQALHSGATIVDVRTVHEYDQGRLPGSVNIPVDRIPANMDRIRIMKKPIIFCGSGDSRSAHVVRFVKKYGVKEIYNGGSWEKLARWAKTA